jgi:hypothetical protein
MYVVNGTFRNIREQVLISKRNRYWMGTGMYVVNGTCNLALGSSVSTSDFNARTIRSHKTDSSPALSLFRPKNQTHIDNEGQQQQQQQQTNSAQSSGRKRCVRPQLQHYLVGVVLQTGWGFIISATVTLLAIRPRERRNHEKAPSGNSRRSVGHYL